MVHMAIDWVVIIAIGGVAVGLFVVPLCFLLPNGNTVANRFVAPFLAILALSLLNNFFLHAGLLQRIPGLSAAGQFLYFALGPLLYFHIKALSEPRFEFRRADWLHFLPVLLSLAAFLPVYGLSPEAKRDMAALYFQQFASVDATGDKWTVLLRLPVAVHIHIVQYIALMVHIAWYSILGLRQLRKHAAAIGQAFSNIARIELDWLKYLCWLTLALCAASLLMLLARIVYADNFSAQVRALPALIVALLIYYVGLLSLRQPAIYRPVPAERPRETSQPAVPAPAEPAAAGREKYESTGLAPAEAEAHWQRLLVYMTQHQPYLASGLTIGQLSEAFGIPVAHLSQVINSCSGLNFFDFINRYRVQYAQHRLSQRSDNDQTVLDIALDAGFNSQSTFYTQFKKWTGVTPSQYRKDSLKK